MNSSSNNSLGEAIFDAYHNHHDPQSNSAISSLSSTPIHSGASSPFFNPLHVHNHTPSLPGSDSEDAALEGRQEIGRLTREKGKGRKVDLRRTKDVPRAELVELYKHYSKTLLPARDISIHHIGNRYWVMADSKQSQFSEVAELKSVWWMDVSAMFYGVPPGKYKVQWRVSLTSDGPVINSEFRTILFDQEENNSIRGQFSNQDISDVVNYPSTTLFQPKSIQEFMTHTDSTVTNVNRKPFRKLFSKEFTTLELPDELVVEDNYQGVFVQIRNHDGWKSGLFIDYVRLVDVDDPTRVLQSTVYRKVEDSVLDDVVNDEGEEYYPSAANSWIHNMLRTPEAQIERAFQRSRAYRQVEPIDPHAVEVEPQPQSSARALSSSSSSTSRSSAARPQTRYNVDPNNAPPGQQFSGYILFALMILLLYFFSDN
ncbi:hypothetical protein BGW38_010568 [Lunasporangiospora selenospora]|uniref:Uncharacterized protein n=1 Tax=Lunasporangiospora selenospora TaxID=979761 RepID=A0A9P6FWV8_9FUNG|nr:hypothetical protein BGW38_010568 [Lunasporangiospora selenospora]